LDNSLASNFVCFLDDKWITGVGWQGLNKARHAISTRGSYLGIQDALRKIRATKGSHCLGAWAGANVCIEDNGSISILTSQEKWDWLKGICTHWLNLLEWGETLLDHKKLQSDHGFMVCQPSVPQNETLPDGFSLIAGNLERRPRRGGL
jgi:hypothetical protein